MSAKKEEIAKLFQEGLNCAQIVLLHFCEKYHMEKTEATRIGCGFGGGVRNGELCGAVSGAVMVIGLKHGNEKSENVESKLLCHKKTAEFTKKFKGKNGSIVCRDLLQCDISTEDGMNNAKNQNLFQTLCVDMVASAIDLLIELDY